MPKPAGRREVFRRQRSDRPLRLSVDAPMSPGYQGFRPREKVAELSTKAPLCVVKLTGSLQARAANHVRPRPLPEGDARVGWPTTCVRYRVPTARLDRVRTW